MKTAIILPVWKRPEITRACFENLSKTGCDIYVAVSEDWAAELCEQFGFSFVYTANQPLGRKKNQLLEFALGHDWDQLMEIGSDNLVDLSKLPAHLSVPADHYGINCNYMVDLEGGRAKFYRIHGASRIWGAGRVASREAVEKAYPLWEDSGQKILDAQANRAFDKAGYRQSVVGGAPLFVGIKSGENLHSYDRFGGVEVSLGKLAGKFPELKNLLDHVDAD